MKMGNAHARFRSQAKLVSDDKTTLHQNWQGQYGLGNRARGTPTTPFSKVPEAMELYINRMETRWKDTTNDIRDILKEFEDKVENGNDPGLKATWNKVLMLHGTPSDRHGVSNFFQKSSAAVIDDMRLRVGNAKTFFANKDATFTDKYVDDVTPNRPHSEHWRTGGTNTGIVPIVAKPGDPSPGVKRKRENIPDDANKTRSKAIRPGSANQIKQICGAKV
ncbi:hypothetical protein BC832DRAFT_554867 [Gaertneriomyces semiglobifer]|nr:hypothetical protein BC832DRAFT_554867 [Gaertneriomyces semiglobifer]